MATNAKAAALCMALLVFLSPVSYADFSLRTLTVTININRDGGANVEELIAITINGTSSRELYGATLATYSDLSTWRERTGLPEMRHHITRATADITNLRVIPQSIERCNSFIGVCQATVVLNYAVPAGVNGSGLVKTDLYKPRTTRYSLVQEALSFEQTKSGDLVLPEGTVISIAISQNAEKIYFSTPPENIKDEPEAFRYDQQENLRYYTGNKRIFNWGGNALSKFQFTYEVEAPLESEVLDFFGTTQKSAINMFAGPEGPAAIIIVLAAAASLYYFNRLNA